MDLELFTWRWLDLLWRASWQAAVLVVLVLVTQWIFGRRLAPKWRYALWLLVLARLLLPVTPSSPWSVFNLTSARPLSAAPRQTKSLENATGVFQVTSSEHENRAPKLAALPEGVTEPASGSPAAFHDPAPRRFSVGGLLRWVEGQLTVIWLTGVALLSMRLAWGNYLFGLQLRRRTGLEDARVLQLWDECRKKLGVRRQLPMVVVPEVESPALFGCFRLKLLLPEEITTRFSHEELRHVFLHELAHVRRGDAMVNWLTAVLQTIHWFNPVLWWAFHRMRVDRELACDALALSHARDGEVRPYGQTVIKLLQGFTRSVVIPGLVGILEDKQQIKERITMIAKFKPSSGWPMLAVALMSLLGCVSLTDAKRDSAPAAAAAHNSHRLPDSAPAPASQFRALRLEQLPADKLGEGILDEGMRPSPDGKSLAFVNWASGNLVLCDAASGQSRDLTTDGTWETPNQYCDSLLWSRDGAQLAYSWTSGETGELRIVPRAGGKPRIVVTFAGKMRFWPQAWSSDGRFILGLLKVSPGARKTRIARVDVPAGRWKVVKELPDTAGWPNLTLSPDGKRLVYDSPKGELRLINVDGSGDRVVVDNPADDRKPIWTPDGRNVLFLSDRLGRYALWTIPMRDGIPSGEALLVRDGFANANAADLLGCTDDGTLYWYTATPRGNVFEAAVDFNAGTMQAPKQVSLRFDGRNRHPAWSADGSKLAYLAREVPGAPDATVVVREVATGREQNVKLPNLGVTGPPQWSGNLDKFVAVALVDGSDRRAIYLYDLLTLQHTLLVDQDCAVSPSLSHDARRMFYVIHPPGGVEGTWKILERDLASGQEQTLYSSDRFLDFPLLSPDGTRLAYSEATADGIAFRVLTLADGATKTAVDFPGARGYRARVLGWLSDKNRLLVKVERKAQQLHIVDVEQKTANPFGPAWLGKDWIRGLAIHPDNHRILLSRDYNQAEVWTLRNLFSNSELAKK